MPKVKTALVAGAEGFIGSHLVEFLLEKDRIVAARNGPSTLIRLGKDEYFVSSAVPAVVYHTRDLFFLADSDLAVIMPEGAQVSDLDGQPIVRRIQHVTWDPIMA